MPVYNYKQGLPGTYAMCPYKSSNGGGTAKCTSSCQGWDDLKGECILVENAKAEKDFFRWRLSKEGMDR